MCGIGGVYLFEGRKLSKSDSSRLLKLFEGLESRGRDAFGFYADNLLFKLPGSFSEVKEQLKAFGGIEKLFEGKRHVLGHTRLATQGDALRNANNHPFETVDFVFAHNGWVRGISKNYDLLTGEIIETDSYVIIAEIQERFWEIGDELKAIADILSYYYYSSAIACWIYSKLTDKLYLYTDGREPLYYVKTDKGLWFASERRMLPKRLRRRAKPCRELKIYEIDRAGQIKVKTAVAKKKKERRLERLFEELEYYNYFYGDEYLDYDEFLEKLYREMLFEEKG